MNRSTQEIRRAIKHLQSLGWHDQKPGCTLTAYRNGITDGLAQALRIVQREADTEAVRAFVSKHKEHRAPMERPTGDET